MVLEHFERVSNAAFYGLIDEAAYFRGMGRKNNLNMADLRKEVMDDLQSQNAIPSYSASKKNPSSNTELRNPATSSSTVSMTQKNSKAHEKSKPGNIYM